MNQKRSKSVIYIYVVPLVLLFGIVICGILTMFYTTTTVNHEGNIISVRWVKDFTIDFSQYIKYESENPQVTESGLRLLEENDLWLQIIDENGDEIKSYEKPKKVTTHYSPYELLLLYQLGTDEYSVFIGEIDDADITYIIGFPLNISKIPMYVDTSRYGSSKVLIIGILIITFLLVIILGVAYNIVISKNLERIRKSLGQIALRTYIPYKSKKFLHEIYDGLNGLDSEIQSADVIRTKNEKSREEWIANITHDLKTPLAPIKGYAELLADSGKSVSAEKSNIYGKIIMKNTVYVEQLVDDLKLTYQLQNDMFPIKRERQNISRFVKEIIIDILNNPEFGTRKISFLAPKENIFIEFDEHLLKRAIYNLIINALVHNSPKTEVTISVKCDSDININIRDNGNGMTEEELSHLFIRYYRGTNTDVKPGGTGLGMAIAKQIIELHGGKILVNSTLNIGTSITIIFSKNN